MADETPISGLDSLGPDYGGINRPSLDTQSFKPFEGDSLRDAEINFPAPKAYPNPIGAESLNHPAGQIRNAVGKAPNSPGKSPTVTAGDYGKLFKAVANANQDKNEYSRVYAYDAGPSGNSFYKRYAAYGQEKFDSIGFSPLRDNEALFNSKTSGWDDFSRMVTNSFVPLFTRGFVSGPKSLVKMLSGDFSADLDDARFYEEAAAIGSSTKGGVSGFFTNTAQSFAYTAGIMTEVALEEAAAILLTAGTAGGAAPVLFATTANAGKNILRAAKGLDSAVDMGRAVNGTVRSLDNISNARRFWDTTKKVANSSVGSFLNPLEGTTGAIGSIIKNEDNLTGLARTWQATQKTVGGMHRDIRALNAALSEARLEGGFVQNTIYDKLYKDYYYKNGKAPTDEEQKLMINKSTEAGMSTVMWNTALIYGSNKITFPSILGRKSMGGGYFKNKIDDVLQMKGGKVIYKEVAEKGVKETAEAKSKRLLQGNFEYVKDGLMTSLKNFKSQPIRQTLKGVGGYFKTNITEALQENAQEAISMAMENYYTHNYYKETGAASHQFNKGLSAYLTDGIGEQFSGKGFETFASGFFMGMFGGGMNKTFEAMQYGYNHYFNKEESAKYAELRNSYGKGIAAKLNLLAETDPETLFDSKIFNYGVQGSIADNAERDLDEMQRKDQKDEALISAVYAALDTNTLNLFTDQLESFKQYSPEEFEEAFGYEKGEGAKYQAKLDSIIKKTKSIEAKYKRVNEQFPNPVDLSKIDKEDPNYEKAALLNSAWEYAKREAIFSHQSFDDVNQRMASIYDTITADPALAKVAANDIQMLFSVDKIGSEIGILKSEVEGLKTMTDPQSKKDYEHKKKKIKALENYLDKFSSYNSYTQRHKFADAAREDIAEATGKNPEDVTQEEIDALLDKKIGKRTEENDIKVNSGLESAYKEYLKLLGDYNDSHIFDRDMDNAFSKLKDYYALGEQGRLLARHVDVLSNPQGFLDAVNRNNEWMERVYKNRKEYFDQMVEAQLKAKEHNDLLNALANQDIYVDLDQLDAYINEGVLPTEFYDGKGKVITADNDKYYSIIEKFVLLSQIQESINANKLDPEMQKEIDDLQKKMKAEIDALEKEEGRVNIAPVEIAKGKTISLKEAAKEVQPGEYIELSFADGQTITYYNDGGTLKFDNAEGEEVNIKRDTTPYTAAVRFKYDMIPNPDEVQTIKEKYDALIEEVYERYAAKKQAMNAQSYNAILPSTPIEDIQSREPELYSQLQQLFQTTVLDQMDPEQVELMTDDQVMNLFTDFVATEDAAAQLIDQYNKQARLKYATKLSGEQEDFEFLFNGSTIDTGNLTTKQVRTYIKTFEGLKADLQKKGNLTTDEKNLLNSHTALINKFEALIRTRGLAGLSPKLKEAKSKLDALLETQDKITRDDDRHVYIIDGKEYDSVTRKIAPLKSKQYDYIGKGTLEKEVYKIFGNANLKDGEGRPLSFDAKVNLFIAALKTNNPPGFNSKNYLEVADLLIANQSDTPEELYNRLLAYSLENTFEANRTAGNYIDAQVKNLFEDLPLEFNEENITREAFDNLFSTEVDPKTNLPKGSLAQIKARVDSNELIILSRGLRVYDEELGIAGEIDLIVADQNGNVYIIDLKTGSKDKWDGWVGTDLYKDRKASKDEAVRAKAEYAENKSEDYELQQAAYANLLYRMIGLEVSKVGILPVQLTLNTETGKVNTASKPTSSALKPGTFSIMLDTSKVQDRIDNLIPKVYIDPVTGDEEVPGIKIATALSPEALKKLRALGFSDAMLELMTQAEIEEAKTFNDRDQAKPLLNKYAKLAMEPVLMDDAEIETQIINEMRRDRNGKSIQNRINMLKAREKMASNELSAMNDTLGYLNNLLESSVDLSESEVKRLLDSISTLEKVIKSSSSKKTKRGQSTAAMIANLKSQIRNEFREADVILNTIRNLKYEIELLESLKDDLGNQIDYYNSLIADPNMETLSKYEIEAKIKKIQKKMGTIEKLIAAIKNAIGKSLQYLNEYLKIWKKADAKYNKFMDTTGYEPLSQEKLGELINSTNPEDMERLAEYPELSRQFQGVQNELLKTMDNVEFAEEVKEQENKRLAELNRALDKYTRQIRYLNELISTTADGEVFDPEAKMSDPASGGPMPGSTMNTTATTAQKTQEAEEDLAKDAVTVSKLTFTPDVMADIENELEGKTYSLEEALAAIEALPNMDELRSYRAILRGFQTVGRISAADGAILKAKFEEKIKQLETPESIDMPATSFAVGATVIAKIDIFNKNLLFAGKGTELTVTRVDGSKKMITLKYGNKPHQVSFDEAEEFLTNMEALTNIVPVEATPILDQADKEKVIESNDIADAFIQDPAAVNKAIEEIGDTEASNLKDKLFKNLEC
jgi:uncharacterized small protein (DUF1192 family)